MKSYIFAILLFLGVSLVTARAGYFQGFETDNGGWFTPTRAALKR